MSRTRKNPYDAPSITSDQGKSAWNSTRTCCALATVLTGALFLVVFITRDPLARVYAEFGIDLSKPTSIAISPSALVAVSLLFLATIAMQFLAGNTAVARAWNRAASGIALVAGTAYAIGVLLPFVTPMYDLS